VPSEDEMILAIRHCPPGETAGLLAEYHEIVDAKLGGTSALLYACYAGRQDVAAAIARYRRSLDVFEAAALGDLDVLRSTLELSPSAADMTAPDGFHPLGLACYFRRKEAVALLLDRGADIAQPAANSTRVAPLHSAVAAGDAEIVALLLNRSAPVDARQQGGFTPLMSAAVRGDRKIAELLLAHGADPAAADESGLSAIDHAIRSGHPELADFLAARPAGGSDAGENHQPADGLMPA